MAWRWSPRFMRQELSEGTTKTHVKSLLEKLGADSKTGTVRVGLQPGFVRYNFTGKSPF